jgi:hypothetical protein
MRPTRTYRSLAVALCCALLLNSIVGALPQRAVAGKPIFREAQPHQSCRRRQASRKIAPGGWAA